jgi:glycolate oxidase iron-sulfur subunit
MSAALPPSADPLVALADRCVQCGLCLPACPTYDQARLEAESPRGRIALVRAWALGTIEPTPTGETHLDQCLGCGSCEAVCPAGVQYGELLVAARTVQRSRRPAGWRIRWIEFWAAHPRLLALALHLYGGLFRWLPRSWRPLPRPPARGARDLPRADATRGVAVFVGCVAETYETSLRAALEQCCRALGIEVVAPPAQTCCGSLHAHSGNRARAEELAARNRSAFSGAETVLTLATGCHEAVAGAVGRTVAVDAIDFLAQRIESLRFRPCDERIALHVPCTQRNVVRSSPALRRLLARVPGLSVVELDAGHGCCGAAGMQMLEAPDRAAQFREPLLDQLHRSQATRLLSSNIGCRLHLAAGTGIRVQHPVEFLAEWLEAPPPSASASTGA